MLYIYIYIYIKKFVLLRSKYIIAVFCGLFKGFYLVVNVKRGWKGKEIFCPLYEVQQPCKHSSGGTRWRAGTEPITLLYFL